MKSKEMGSDGLRTLKDLYSQSTQKLKDLVQKHYSFHYKRSKRDKYRREKSNLMLNSSSQDIKSGGLIPPKENIDPKVHQNLLKALKNLKQEMNDLTIENQNKEEKILELDNLRTRHNLLKTEYNESKTAIFNLEADLETKESDINSLSWEIKRLKEKIENLKNENKEMEGIIEKDRDSEVETLREYKNVLNRTKKAWENQVLSLEQEFEDNFMTLEKLIMTKTSKIKSLETTLMELKHTQLPNLQISSKQQITQKLLQIQDLNSRNKDLTKTVMNLQTSIENSESQLK